MTFFTISDEIYPEIVPKCDAGFWTEDAPFVSGVVVCCRCHWERRPQEGGGIAQAWATWPEWCFGTKWYGDVPGARSTQDGDTGNEDDSSFARFFKLDKYAMFSFAMTSGLASDSDEFSIIITLRHAHIFEDTGRQKNADSLFHQLLYDFFHNFSRNLSRNRPGM